MAMEVLLRQLRTMYSHILGVVSRLVLLALLGMVSSSCKNGSGGEPIEDAAAFATVYGTVVDGSGAVVVNAAVSAEVRSPDCSGQVVGRSGSLNVNRTTASGRYSLLLILSSGPGARCVRLSVLPSEGTTATWVDLPRVDFRFFNTDSIAKIVVVP